MTREHRPRPYRLDKPTGCDIEDCERPHHANGLCLPHYRRRNEYGDPLAGPPLRSRRGTGPSRSPRQAKPDTYWDEHKLVRAARGPAWQHGCEHCEKQAQCWATKHDGNNANPADYLALCWQCHARYDNLAKNFPDNRGSKRTPESREKMRQAALLREARKRGEVM